jgi:formamidopyrimidine-DNA glycosylase
MAAYYTKRNERHAEAAVKPKAERRREVCRVCGAPADIIAFEVRRKTYYCGPHTPESAWKA